MKVKVRKATMTNKERVEALLRREKPDRVPFLAGGQSFAMLQSGGYIADQYTKREWAYEVEKKACRDFDWVFAPALVPPLDNRGAFGGEVKLPTSKYSQGRYVVKWAAETAEEVMALKAPDIKAKYPYPPELIDYYKRIFQEEDDNRPFVTIGALTIANTAGFISGADKMCKWMLQKPEVAHRLMRLAADLQIANAQYFKDTFGVDRIMPTGAAANGSNQLISPKHFEQFILPYYKEVHQTVLAMGFKHLSMHLCGDHNLNLPYWQQVPLGDPGICWGGNEIDLETEAKYFPNDIIGGNLDTTIIQNGTPDEVYEAARKVIEQGKSLATGFIFKLACGMPPYAPVENIRAITRALNDFGWYD